MTLADELNVGWNNQCSEAARSQGWGIFETNRDAPAEKEVVNGQEYGHRPFELQREDDMGVFGSDAEAHAFVRSAAMAGETLAVNALAFLQAYSPAEYTAVMAAN